MPSWWWLLGYSHRLGLSAIVASSVPSWSIVVIRGDLNKPKDKYSCDWLDTVNWIIIVLLKVFAANPKLKLLAQWSDGFETLLRGSFLMRRLHLDIAFYWNRRYSDWYYLSNMLRWSCSFGFYTIGQILTRVAASSVQRLSAVEIAKVGQEDLLMLWYVCIYSLLSLVREHLSFPI